MERYVESVWCSAWYARSVSVTTDDDDDHNDDFFFLFKDVSSP